MQPITALVPSTSGPGQIFEHRCSAKTIECCYPDSGRPRQQPPAAEGQEVDMIGLMDSGPSPSVVDGTPFVTTRLQDSHSGDSIQPTPFLAPAAVQTDQTTSQHANLLDDNRQNLPAQSLGMSPGAGGPYGMPASPAQPSTQTSRDLNHQFPNNSLNSALTSYPSLNPYDFGLLSNQSMELPELGNCGYSAINWLSPKDLGYSEFNYQAQYFDVDNFNLWTEPVDQSIMPQTHGAGEIITISQSNPHVSDECQGNKVPMNTDSVQQMLSLPDSTPSIDCSMTCSIPSKSSNFYLNGAGGREPRYGRLRRHRVDWAGKENTPLAELETESSNENHMSFPSSMENCLKGSDADSTTGISQHNHEKISHEFHTAQSGSNHASDREPLYFPSMGIFNMTKQLYFESFHPIFPLLHKSSPSVSTESWLVELAIAAIGVGYLGTRASQQCSEAFIDLLIKCLEWTGTSENYHSIGSELRPGSLDIIQAQILCCVAMCHSRSLELVGKSVSMRSQKESTDPHHQRDDTWREFILKESKTRAGYCIFSDFRPQMQLEDARAPLPCSEDIWEACDETSWQQARSQRPGEIPSLLVALESLYKKKIVDPDVSEFGKIMLIHGLYHRTWEVARYHKDTLSNWIPSVPGTRAASPTTQDPITEWLPRNPIFSKWRNSACDCLDVLHWSANSYVAQRAGIEHPTILHLHLARLLLLTPVSTIQSLSSLILQNSRSNSVSQETLQAQYHEDRSEVLRWFIQDQYKARLALVHAGAIFWHVRRYSHDSMLEPFAVLLSTLVVWAYATSSQAIDQQQRQGLAKTGNSRQDQGNLDLSRSQQSSKDSEDDLVDLPFINLDRLCDDELIQIYVLHGSRMKGFMAGIGDICKEGAVVKILREGARIIACNGTHRGRFLQAGGEQSSSSMAVLPTWGIGVRHALFLRELADVSQRRLV
ncbi:uncharacterized protein RSE6_09711 [Rhynchosporium secalis]|uniref:Xylanolytic transcriptional activator regulatory domain-containing protein n=1 Tax=Rhynchosporium secalis TaxID=38038 RepID=A0A1E1MIL7_RHYSE|nr:uncharacterized protein RSE6_09711 [Rhynchosporium secalis]